MALSASTVWQVQTDGNDTNGGGYVTGTGTDYSLQAAKNTVGNNISTTDAVANGTTTITSSGASFTSAITGNIVYFTGGTGSITAQWRQATFVSATSITIDTAIGASTGMTMNIGGALLSPSIAANNAAVAGQTVFVKNGTYTISSNTTNTAGGSIAFGSASCVMIGYSTTRSFGNTDTAPVFQNSGSTITPLQSGGSFYNITFDGNSQTAARLINAAAMLIFCTYKNFNTVNGVATAAAIACRGTANTATVNFAAMAYCELDNNTATPTSGHAFKCLSYLNTGATTDGFAPGAPAIVAECHAVSNGRSGFRGSGTTAVVVNCHAQSNGTSGTGYGYQANAAGNLRALNCTGVLNATGLIDTSVNVFQSAVSAVTADVYVSASGNNYSLNNLIGAGAALRNAGRMLAAQTYPRGLTTALFDIGGVQSRVPFSALGFNGGVNQNG